MHSKWHRWFFQPSLEICKDLLNTVQNPEISYNSLVVAGGVAEHDNIVCARFEELLTEQLLEHGQIASYPVSIPDKHPRR